MQKIKTSFLSNQFRYILIHDYRKCFFLAVNTVPKDYGKTLEKQIPSGLTGLSSRRVLKPVRPSLYIHIFFSSSQISPSRSQTLPSTKKTTQLSSFFHLNSACSSIRITVTKNSRSVAQTQLLKEQQQQQAHQQSPFIFNNPR